MSLLPLFGGGGGAWAQIRHTDFEALTPPMSIEILSARVENVQSTQP